MVLVGDINSRIGNSVVENVTGESELEINDYGERQIELCSRFRYDF